MLLINLEGLTGPWADKIIDHFVGWVRARNGRARRIDWPRPYIEVSGMSDDIAAKKFSRLPDELGIPMFPSHLTGVIYG